MKPRASKPNPNSETLDEIHDQGEQILSQAQQLFAKAQQAQGAAPSEDDLEDDLQDFDEPEDTEDEEEEEPSPNQGKMAKAAQSRGKHTVHVDDDGTEFVDATEQLSALNSNVRKLEKMIKAQNSQIDQLTRIVGMQQQSLGLMAKAQGGLLNTPQRPKSRVSVPTGSTPSKGGKKLDLNRLFTKAYSHPSVGEELVGVLDSARQRGDAQTFLKYLPEDLRAEALEGKE